MDENNGLKYMRTLIYAHNLVTKFNSCNSKFATRLLGCLNIHTFDGIALENQDYNAVIIIPLKLALLLSLPSGCWVLSRFFSRDFFHRQQCHRWTKIIVDYKLQSDSVCYASIILYHNLREHLNTEHLAIELKSENMIYSLYLVTRLFIIWNSSVDPRTIFSKYKKLSQPRYAEELKLSFAYSLVNFSSKEIEDILHYYFSVPKYLQQGDLVLVPIPEFYECHSNLTIQPQYLYFFVESLHYANDDSNGKKGYLVSKEKTTLYLSGTKKTKIPYVNGITTCIDKKVPSCLNNIYEQVVNIFLTSQPFKSIKNSYKSFDMDDEKVDHLDTVDKTEESLSSSTYDAHGNVLLIGPSGSGKITIIKLLAERFSYHIKWINCLLVRGDTSAATEGKLRQEFSGINPYSIIVLTRIGSLSHDKDGNSDPRVFIALREHFKKFSHMRPKPFIIGTNENQSDISDDIWSLFIYPVFINCPSFDERKDTLLWLLSAYLNLGCNISSKFVSNLSETFSMVSHRTSGFYFGDLKGYILRVHRFCVERRSREFENSNNGVMVMPIHDDFISALDDIQDERSKALNLPRIPKVEWKDVGGLEEAKKELINTIQLPIKYPSIIAKSFRRSGILLYGPPGTGKTLLAKSVACECGLNFLSVKGPELINMYIGQSEENIRDVFAKAKSASPCVIFFDELDSLAPKRGRSGDSGGVMDRIVSALLAELDGVSSSSDVFVLAATNRPDLLDPALLRPGRFEKQIYLGLCESRDDQLKILQAVVTKIPLKEDVCLRRICDSLPFTLTGADFAALAADAFYIATRRVVRGIKEGKESIQVEVCEEDFLEASSKIIPSVSVSELTMYKEMKNRRTKS